MYQPHDDIEEPYKPDKDDFIIYPDKSKNQIEFEGMEGKPKIDQEAYEKACQEYEKAYQEYENKQQQEEETMAGYFEPFQLEHYIWEEIQKAKEELSQQKNNIKEKGDAEETDMTKSNSKILKIVKIAQENENIPSADLLSTYVEALKTYLENSHNINKELKKIISNLPSAKKVKNDFSETEAEILYESVGYAWKKITGQDIAKSLDKKSAPKTLFGNYWMLKNGILLKGINHFDIIKRNMDMFCSLLKLHPFTMHQYMASSPNKLIQYVLRNGGVRIFIDKDRNAFFQMSENTYSRWGRAKVKGFDFHSKTVKVIDFHSTYNGWKSGINIKL